MRITVLTAGTLGDVLPYQALGQELVRRGHAVRITAGDHLEAKVPASSCELHWVKDPYALGDNEGSRKLIEAGGGARFLQQMREQAGARLDRFLDGCTDACEGADLILYGNLGFAGPHIGEALGIPYFAVPLSPTLGTRQYPAMTFSELRLLRGTWNRMTHFLAGQMFWKQIGPPVNSWRRRRLGLKSSPLWGPFAGIARIGYPFVYLISEALFPRPADWPGYAHLAGFQDQLDTELALVEELEAFLQNGPKPILVAFGPNWNHDREAKINACIQAAKSANIRLILCDPAADPFADDLAPGVIRVSFAPFPRLLSRVLGVLHHGGAGTSYACVRNQTPSAAHPMFGDQFVWARALIKLGSGPEVVPASPLTSPLLCQLFRDLIENEHTYRNNLADVSHRLQTEKPCLRAADLIEGYCSTHKQTARAAEAHGSPSVVSRMASSD